MSDIDCLRYVAAVLDYNQHIRMSSRFGRGVPIISVANRNLYAASLFIQAFGGYLSGRANGLHVFQRSHGQAVEVVRKIRPYLVVSQNIADQVLEWRPAARKKQTTPKTPCPTCPGLMVVGSMSCADCYKKSARRVMFRPANPWAQLSVDGRRAPGISGARKVGASD